MILLVRFRSLLIRISLGLVAVGSLVAAVALFTYARQTSTPVDAESAGTELAGTLQTDNDAPDFSATNAPLSLSIDAAAASARALAQLDALRADTSFDWTAGLTSDSAFSNDTDFSSMTVDGIDDLTLMAAINPLAAGWLSPALEDSPLLRADAAASRFGGVGFGGGASGGSGGDAGGGSGAGEISGRSAGASDAQSTLHTQGAQPPGRGDEERGNPAERSADNNDHGSHANNGSGHRNGGPSSGVARSEDPEPSSRESVSVPEPSSLLLTALGATFAARRLRRRTAR